MLRRPRHRAHWHYALSVAVCLTAGLVLVAGLPVLAAGNTLTGSVSPRSGTTATSFAFTARYIGVNGASTVIARLAGNPLTVNLTLASGSAKDGTWAASRSLPAGSWTVQFEAHTSQGKLLDTSTFGPVTVSAPTPTPKPTATPKPTPRPTPKPTVKPTAPPTSSPSSPSSSAPASATAGATASPPSTPIAVGGATEPTPRASAAAAGGSAPADRTGSLLLATLLGLLVIVGVGGIALLAGRRRAEEEPSLDEPAPDRGTPPEAPAPAPVVVDEAAAAAFAARVSPPVAPVQPAPLPAGTWEAYADIDDRPIGTNDELPPGDYQRRPHGDGQ